MEAAVAAAAAAAVAAAAAAVAAAAAAVAAAAHTCRPDKDAAAEVCQILKSSAKLVTIQLPRLLTAH